MYLSEQPVDLATLIAAVQSPERGGIACFLGTVRNHHQGRDVVRLEYSAYAPMVEAECARIVAEAESRWNVAIGCYDRDFAVVELYVGENHARAQMRVMANDRITHVIEVRNLHFIE